MSAYIGDQLYRVVDEIVSESCGSEKPLLNRSFMSFPVNTLPDIPRDASDRNRTSPFAFAGNKFEFRAVGSSQNCARTAMILNAILADSLHFMADEIEQGLKSNNNVEEVVPAVVKKTLKEHQRAIYNGNGYSQEWVEEAKKRGIPNLATTPEAVQQMASEKNVKLFEKLDILTAKELHSMQHVNFEIFIKHVNIEADCLYMMANSYVLPTALEYKQRLMSTLDAADPVQAEVLANYNRLVSQLIMSMRKLNEVRTKAKEFDEDKLFEQSTFYRNQVMDAMTDTRAACDQLEMEIDDKIWPFPKYSELLFLK